MSVVDRVIEFITNDLNIKISKKNKELIINKFYPDIKDKFYWCVDGDGFYEGIISKEEYEKIKTLPSDTQIDFPEIAKYVNDECKLKEISESFKEDIDKIKTLYDKGFQDCATYFDLMFYLYENKILEK